MNTIETDDHSSVNSFSLVEDDQIKTTVIESDTDESFHGEGCKLQARLHLKDKNQREKFDVSSESTLKESPFVQVTKVRYLGLLHKSIYQYWPLGQIYRYIMLREG